MRALCGVRRASLRPLARGRSAAGPSRITRLLLAQLEACRREVAPRLLESDRRGAPVVDHLDRLACREHPARSDEEPRDVAGPRGKTRPRSRRLRARIRRRGRRRSSPGRPPRSSGSARLDVRATPPTVDDDGPPRTAVAVVDSRGSCVCRAVPRPTAIPVPAAAARHAIPPTHASILVALLHSGTLGTPEEQGDDRLSSRVHLHGDNLLSSGADRRGRVCDGRLAAARPRDGGLSATWPMAGGEDASGCAVARDDAIVLDLMLPGNQRFATAGARIAACGRTCSCSRRATRSRIWVSGLDTGADDYLVSPSRSRTTRAATGAARRGDSERPPVLGGRDLRLIRTRERAARRRLDRRSREEFRARTFMRDRRGLTPCPSSSCLGFLLREPVEHRRSSTCGGCGASTSSFERSTLHTVSGGGYRLRDDAGE